MRSYCGWLSVLLVFSGFVACKKDSGDGERPAREEVLLAVEVKDSPLDLLQATEVQTFAYGATDDEVLLEALVYDAVDPLSAAATSEGRDILLEADVYDAVFHDEDGDGTGTLEILDAQEVKVAQKEDVTLPAFEVKIFKQAATLSLDEKLEITANELLEGRWSALAEAAGGLLREQGIGGESAANSFQALVEKLRVDVLSMQDLLIQASTDTELPPGVNARPSLFRVPDDQSDFATDFSFDSLIGASSRESIQQFLGAVSREIHSFAVGRPFERRYLPDVLLDVDGYPIYLDSSQVSIRFRLNWNDAGDLDLHVITPAGNEIYWNDPLYDGGSLDVDNVDGGSSSVENVIFADAAPGTYSAFVDYFDGVSPRAFELTAYVNGRIVKRLRGVLDPPSMDAESRSDRIEIRVQSQ